MTAATTASQAPSLPMDFRMDSANSRDNFGAAEIKDMRAKAETRQARETERAMIRAVTGGIAT